MEKNTFFIKGNVPSLKNSKRWTGKYLISSKRVMEYRKETLSQYKTMKSHFFTLLSTIEKPYKISFKVIRGSRHRFDYINMAQLPLDMMVEVSMLDDDNANVVIPVFEPYEYSKESPGIYITILD